MKTELRPAHEVILGGIVFSHETIIRLIKIQGGDIFSNLLHLDRIHVFCAFLQTLQKSIIPDDDLVEVISKLKDLQSNKRFQRLGLDDTIRNLEERLA